MCIQQYNEDWEKEGRARFYLKSFTRFPSWVNHIFLEVKHSMFWLNIKGPSIKNEWSSTYFKINTTVGLINASIPSHNYFYFFMRTFQIYILTSFQIQNTVLLTVITIVTEYLYVRSPERIHLINGSLPSWPASPHCPHLSDPSNHYSALFLGVQGGSSHCLQL